MADTKISALGAAPAIANATQLLVLASVAPGPVTNYKATPNQFAQYVVKTGAVNPNGVVSGYAGQLYTEVPGDGTAQLWINVDGGTTWV
jgi:hypothetical protein